jgi:hypothetical protein
MGKIISIHEYELKKGVDPKRFEYAILHARREELLRLPGLTEQYFIRGIRGNRRGRYGAVWVYDGLQSWEALWGPLGQPRAPEEYPANWKKWEHEDLAPYLTQDPDTIRFTSYQAF